MKNITVTQFIKELTDFAEANGLMEAEIISIGSCCGEFANKRNPFSIRIQDEKSSRVAYINSITPKSVKPKKDYTFADVQINEQFVVGTGKNKQIFTKVTPFYVSGERDPRLGINEPGYHVNAISQSGGTIYFEDTKIVHKLRKV